MHSQLLHLFQQRFSGRVILTGSLLKLTLDFANFTGVAGSDFAMLSAASKTRVYRGCSWKQKVCKNNN
jgi:hypothetical protein